MNNFSKTISWFLITNKRAYIKSFLILAVATFVLMAANTGLTSGYSGGVNRLGLNTVLGLIPTILFIASLVPAANIIKDLKTKQQRTLYLMLPASNSNKFWARILIAVVSAFILFPIAVFVADIAQMLVSFIVCGDYVFVTKELIAQVNFTHLQPHSPSMLLSTLTVIALTMWGFSSYILGGFVFRKVPGLFTTVLWIIFWILVALSIGTIINHLTHTYNNIEIKFMLGQEPTMSLVVIAISMMFTVLNLWGSYCIHNRMSIITHKWFNI